MFPASWTEGMITACTTGDSGEPWRCYCERNADHQFRHGNHKEPRNREDRTLESLDKDGLLEEDDDASTDTETRSISCLP